jgi:hypothetical protein
VSKFTLKVFSIVLLAGLCCAASDKEWAEVRSQHFRVITDGSEKDARRVAREFEQVAREFEQIRFAMSSIYPKLRLDSGAPLLVLCPRGEASMKSLAPQFWKRKGFKPAGLFQHGWDQEYALVRLDEIRPSSDPKFTGELARLDLRDDLSRDPLQPKRAESSPRKRKQRIRNELGKQ